MIFETIAGYEIGLDPDVAPDVATRNYGKHARFFREYQPSVQESPVRCVVTISDVSGGRPKWPDLALMLPTTELFPARVLIVPETKIAFIGSLDILLAYRLDALAEVWEDTTEYGILGWARAGDHVLMSGELELAAWDIHAERRWSSNTHGKVFVEPPWSYTVKDGIVHLDVMGKLSEFPLETGPVS